MNFSKKISLAAIGFLMAITVQVNGAVYYKPPAHYGPPEESPCRAPTCRPSPYCGPNCIPAPYCGEFNVKAELIYWRPELCGLESAFGRTSISTVVTPGVITTTVKESDKEPHSKWTPGFRVGADVAFGCFDLEADYTHYNGRAFFHDGSQNGDWKIGYDQWDLIFGRRFFIAPCFYFKPFIGARGLVIHQSLKSHLKTYFTSIIGDNTIYTEKHDKENFWGVGPELGLEADWYLGSGFTLYGMFDVVSYYGQVHSKNYDVDTFTSTVSISDGKKRHCFNDLATDGAIGIRWDKTWHRSDYDVLFMLKLDLESHRIYDFSNLGSDGTLSLDGAAFGAGIGFRY